MTSLSGWKLWWNSNSFNQVAVDTASPVAATRDSRVIDNKLFQVTLGFSVLLWRDFNCLMVLY